MDRPRGVRPLGIFRARRTRDGQALARDGQSYVRINGLECSSDCDRPLEIMFEDGLWMLATRDDLDVRDT